MNNIQIETLFLALGLGFSSCMSTRDTVKINKVEMGMTKDEVRNLLGKPLFKNANETGEEWGYRKLVGKIADHEEVIFTVVFSPEGKVMAYNSAKACPRHYGNVQR